MSRHGTCKYAWQIQQMYRFDAETEREEKVVDTSDEYTCQYLNILEHLPPPINRRHNGFRVNEGDCDACQCYEPVAVPEIVKR